MKKLEISPLIIGSFHLTLIYFRLFYTQEENDDELEDIETLRRIAMESINKKAKEEQHNQMQNNFEMFQSQPTESAFLPSLPPVFASHSYPSARMPRMQPNYNARPHFVGGPPHNMMNFPVAPLASQFHPGQPLHPEFAPIPHVNPQFMAQPQIFPSNYAPPMDYLPTPAARLSPRSLE